MPASMDTTERILESTVETSYSYVYNGSQLVQEIIVTKTTVDDETTTETETLNYSYDASGTPMAVEYNGTTYYYATNLQGDITAILNTSGTAVVTYTYDAWGNPLTTAGTLSETLGESNTLRYRGYVYDSDTGLYYLQSRYYDPELGRFINADIYVATGQGLIGNNMFTYCLNNPIIYSDSSGRNAEALEYWITVMWWLCGVDMVLPFGDIIYSIGIIILLADAMSSGSETQETYKAAKEKAVSAASDMLDYASTAAPPHLHQTKAEREHKLPPDRFIPKTVKTAFALT